VRDFEDFKKAFVLTDALRCHIQSDRIPEKALSYCARHLHEELKQFPNLHTVVTLGEDAYQQFQRDVLERKGDEIRSFDEILKPQGWAQEDVPFPLLKTGTLHVVYTYHPIMGYKHSESIAAALPPL
jgi:uracil-DNA glycosylase